MNQLFKAAEKYVIIYANNTDQDFAEQAKHEKHRRFTDWVTKNTTWKLHQHIPNKAPYDHATGTGSISDFYIFSPSNV